MLGRLVPCGGGQPIPLLKPRLVLGRLDSCDIPLRFSTVSGRHCELELRDGYWYVQDLGSTNGTRVNNLPCQSGRLLPNDILSIASHRYTVVYTPPREPVVARQESPTPAVRAPVAQADTRGALGRLVPCGGGEPIPLRRPRLVVGRHAQCDVVLHSGAVSGRHCELELRDGAWHVRDLGSRHGIRVDGTACHSAQLKPGSVLWIAGQRYHVEYAGPGGKHTPRPPSSLFGRSLLEAAGLQGIQDLPSGGPEEDEMSRRHRLDDSE